MYHVAYTYRGETYRHLASLSHAEATALATEMRADGWHAAREEMQALGIVFAG